MSEGYTGKVAAVVIPRTSFEEEFLIAKRSDNGDWEFPGGKQHVDESIIETAEREIMEEFSLKISAQRSKPEYAWRGGGYDIVPVYATHDYANLEALINREKMTDHVEYRFIRSEMDWEKAEEKLGEELKALEAFNVL